MVQSEGAGIFLTEQIMTYGLNSWKCKLLKESSSKWYAKNQKVVVNRGEANTRHSVGQCQTFENQFIIYNNKV